MKKLIIGIMLLFIVSGCGMKEVENTPREAVKDWLNSYQVREEGVVETLEDWLSHENMEEDYRKEYQNILEKQYQNLSYELLSEDIDGEKATIDVQIEVLDYNKSIEDSKDYFKNHQEEFVEEIVPDEKIEDLKEFIEYKFKNLNQVEDKVKYTITFDLIKDNNKWKVQEISKETFLKMYGLY